MSNMSIVWAGPSVYYLNLQYGQLIRKCLLDIGADRHVENMDILYSTGHTLKLNELCTILMISMKI
jgi:hypothetical protein